LWHKCAGLTVSQGSVATCLGCDGICNDRLITNLLQEWISERSLKKGRYLMQLWSKT